MQLTLMAIYLTLTEALVPRMWIVLCVFCVFRVLLGCLLRALFVIAPESAPRPVFCPFLVFALPAHFTKVCIGKAAREISANMQRPALAWFRMRAWNI